MQWVPLPEAPVDPRDAPRPLTEQEIEYIIAHLPAAPAADPESSRVARDGVASWMKEELRQVSLAPSAIPELIEEIVNQHRRSLVAPGTPVGLAAAEAIGATTTQMTLNSVHPDEEIVVQRQDGSAYVGPIGVWIDGLLAASPDRVKLIPENRTEYLELEEPVMIVTPDQRGAVTWAPLTAVTRHLPVGDLVQITTLTGRTVRVTQSKSLLIWNGSELIQTPGKEARAGMKVPVMAVIPPLPFTAKSEFLSAASGQEWGEILATGGVVPEELWTASSSTVEATLTQYLRHHPRLSTTDPSLSRRLAWAATRLGVIGSFITEGKNHHYDIESPSRSPTLIDTIKEVEWIPASPFVYDVTVPTTTNFSLLNGLGVADTFHTSGSAKSASFSISAMRDLISAKKVPRNESCEVHFTNKAMSYEDVLDSRRYIVGSTVADFVTDYDIAPDLPQFWWHREADTLFGKPLPRTSLVLRLYLNRGEMYKHRVTSAMIARALEGDDNSVSVFHSPMSEGWNRDDPSLPPILDLYPNPSLVGDRVKDKLKKAEKGVKVESIPYEMAEQLFLETVVVPLLKGLRIKGVAGITQITPVVQPVWSMVAHQKRVALDDLIQESYRKLLGPAASAGRLWALYTNPMVMKRTGLIVENLGALCQEAGLRLAAKTPARVGRAPAILYVETPSDRFRDREKRVVVETASGQLLRQVTDDEILVVGEQTLVADDLGPRNVEGKHYRPIPPPLIHEGRSWITVDREEVTDLSPQHYVEAKVAAARQLHKDQVREETQKRQKESLTLPEYQRRVYLRRPLNVPRPRILKAVEFVFGCTDGSNLKGLMALPGIDRRRTTCNSMATIASTLGIEAARTFLVRALSNTIANSNSYVHPSNITFVAEFITSRGEPHGATYSGISRQPGGHLSLATLERAGEVFTKSAEYGRREDIRNVSASVVVGTRMAIGTGSFHIAEDIPGQGTVVDDELFTARRRLPVGEDLDGDDGLGALAAPSSFDSKESETRTDVLDIPFHELVGESQSNRITDLAQLVAPERTGTPGTDSTITALEGGPVEPPPTPLLTEGLEPPPSQVPLVQWEGLPMQLEEMFRLYPEVVEPMPVQSLDSLPDLSGMVLEMSLGDLHQLQQQEVRPVDLTALEASLRG